MKKLAEFLINRRRVLTAVMLVLTAVCAVLALRVPINPDRSCLELPVLRPDPLFFHLGS